MNELINKDNEWIIHFLGSLDRLLDNVEHLSPPKIPIEDFRPITWMPSPQNIKLFSVRI